MSTEHKARLEGRIRALGIRPVREHHGLSLLPWLLLPLILLLELWERFFPAKNGDSP